MWPVQPLPALLGKLEIFAQQRLCGRPTDGDEEIRSDPK
jgi:hypothetical protein